MHSRHLSFETVHIEILRNVAREGEEKTLYLLILVAKKGKIKTLNIIYIRNIQSYKFYFMTILLFESLLWYKR